MCIDYGRLFSVRKFDSLSLLRLDEARNAFAGVTFFSNLDLGMAHHKGIVKLSCHKSCIFKKKSQFLQNVKYAVQSLQCADD